LFVAYDLTRLFLGPAHVTPRGIDRVDVGYARHFLSHWKGDAAATLVTPFGVKVLDRGTALALVDWTEAYWREACDPGDDHLMQQLMHRLIADPQGKNVFIRGSRLRQAWGMAQQIFANGKLLVTTPGASALPKSAVYLNTGQMGIAVPRLLAWLEARRDVCPVFMLHDLIPIEYAQFVPQASRFFHDKMVANTITHAAGLITTTKAVSAAVRQEILRRGHAGMPILSAPLPVPEQFARRRDSEPALAEAPYFVVVSSIEPRKNHALLLNVWRALAESEGERVPTLVVVGTRWHGHHAVTDAVKNSALIRDHIVEVGGLSTPALHRLLSNARGLLMPSFAEGFGLPIIEALALGVPIIASDIAAHREAGGSDVVYLDVADHAGWTAAVRAVMAGRTTGPRRYTVRTWEEYFRTVEPFLADIAAAKRPGALRQITTWAASGSGSA
jgi:glycosyltransferase involved in cell wall biosynthesis